MKTLNPSRPPHPCETISFLFAIIIAAVAIVCTAGTQAQPLPSAASLVDTLRSRINSATEQHAPALQLGTLWLQLANVYEHQFDLSQAEDAYNRALTFLSSPTTQPALADVLQGLGSLYFETGRSVEAEHCLRRSLAIAETLGNQARVAALHETIAMGLVFVHKFREGETESSRALELLQSQPNADSREIVSALVTHSYALCFQGKCAAALDEANRAVSLVKTLFPSDSPQIAAAWMALGFSQWRSGALEQGGDSMREAIRIVLTQARLPPLLQQNAQLVVFRQYAAYLKSTHRKPEAAQLEAQILQLQSQRPATCLNCTINAAALTTPSHQP